MDRIRVGVALAALVALFLLLAPGSPIALPPACADDGDSFFEDEVTFSAKQVNRAIDKGIAWLRSKQQADGSWGLIQAKGIYGGARGAGYAHPAGPTALALYTLLRCKVPADDPQILKGFEYIRKSGFRKPAGSYETSALLLAVCATAEAPKPRAKKGGRAKRLTPKLKLKGTYRAWARELVRHLVSKRFERAWRYQVNEPGTTHGGENDLSSTHLATLALFAAHELGIKVKRQVWEDILGYTLEQQELDGPSHVSVHPRTGFRTKARARGFAYIRGDSTPRHGRACGSMTACGLTNIVLARRVLSDGGSGAAAWSKRSDAGAVQLSLVDGTAWLERNWSAFENPPGRSFSYHVYYVFAVRRAMEVLGNRLIGKHNWYSEMGQMLLNHQVREGFWRTWSMPRPCDTLDTCFALLFLKRAPRPHNPRPPRHEGPPGETPPMPGK
ncbi:MAG: hypothetical protein QNJ90_00250 [Planctomycetota bacterium]|nr:hypothetical protein [Planctomycetota bacterium]